MSRILVFFHAQKCGHSRRMDSIVDHYMRSNRGLLKVAKVEVAERPDLAKRFNVTSAPTLLLLDNLAEMSRIEGRATLPDMKLAFDTHIGAVDADVASIELATAG